MSRLIKSQWAQPLEKDKKIISLKQLESHTEDIPTPQEYIPLESERKEILEKAQMEADWMIQQAAVHAQSIREKIQSEQASWEQEKQSMVEIAKSEGFNQGLEEGRIEGHNEYAEKLLFAKEIVDSSRTDYKNHIQSAERTILELGIKTAEKILGKSLKENSEEFLLIVKRALKETRDYREIQLHIHPVHYGYLVSQKDELLALFPKEVDFYIYPDDELGEDTCIIESSNGRVDASVDVQLKEIKMKLIELLESGI